uniref:PDZ domain-containing protein n=1 Tax=Macrostomum lignano TaxID=282301 RepID=A0A1I8FGW2_9PLAT
MAINAVGVFREEIICGGLVFLDGQMRVGDVVLEVTAARLRKRKEATRLMEGGQGTVCLTVRRREPAGSRCPLPRRHSQSAERGLAGSSASPTATASAVLNSSKMSHSRSFDLLLTTPERGPESLWFEAAATALTLASQCQRGGQTAAARQSRLLAQLRQPPLRCLPLLSCRLVQQVPGRPPGTRSRRRSRPQRQRQSAAAPPLPARSSQPLPQQLARKFSVPAAFAVSAAAAEASSRRLCRAASGIRSISGHGSLMVADYAADSANPSGSPVAQTISRAAFWLFQALAALGGPAGAAPSSRALRPGRGCHHPGRGGAPPPQLPAGGRQTRLSRQICSTRRLTTTTILGRTAAESLKILRWCPRRRRARRGRRGRRRHHRGRRVNGRATAAAVAVSDGQQ